MTDKIKNLCLRTATGIAFVAVLVGGILWSNVTFTLLFAVITGLSVWEFCQVVNRRADVQTNAVICTVAGIYLFLAVSGFCSNLTPSGVFIPYLLSVVYLLVSELYLKSEHALNNWTYTMMSQMYVALPFASLNVLAYQPEASDIKSTSSKPAFGIPWFLRMQTFLTGECIFRRAWSSTDRLAD